MADGAPSRKRITLTGKRFDGGRLPIDSLSELEHYQNAIRIAAEYDWKKDHPGEPLPPGFRESMGLTIEKINEGSADIYLVFEQIAEHREYGFQAQDTVDEQIAAAYAGEPLPPMDAGAAFEVRSELAGIGSTLIDDQGIQYYFASVDGPAVEITQTNHVEAAERLMTDGFLLVNAPAPQGGLSAEPRSLLGRVIAVNADKRSFELVTEQFGAVKGFYKNDPSLLDDLRAQMDEAEQGPLTRIRGSFQSRDGEPMRFNHTYAVERVEFDTTAEGMLLAKFAALEPGWAGGAGAEVSSVALDAAQALLNLLPTEDHVRSIAPTEDGGIQFEWVTDAEVRAVEILENGHFELFRLGANDRRGTLEETVDVRVAAEFAGLRVQS